MELNTIFENEKVAEVEYNNIRDYEVVTGDIATYYVKEK